MINDRKDTFIIEGNGSYHVTPTLTRAQKRKKKRQENKKNNRNKF